MSLQCFRLTKLRLNVWPWRTSTCQHHPPELQSDRVTVAPVVMAVEAPDPRTFKSWEDAFQYPVPVVRKLEQQLRSSADENREKLRSLVG